MGISKAEKNNTAKKIAEVKTQAKKQVGGAKTQVKAAATVVKGKKPLVPTAKKK